MQTKTYENFNFYTEGCFITVDTEELWILREACFVKIFTQNIITSKLRPKPSIVMQLQDSDGAVQKKVYKVLASIGQVTFFNMSFSNMFACLQYKSYYFADLLLLGLF